MNRIFNLLAHIVILVWISVHTLPMIAQDIVVETEEAKRLHLMINHFAEERGFSGSILIEKDGKIILCNGYGMAHRGKKIKFTPATAYSIGTLSQHFMAVSMMLLYQNNRVDLQAPISRYLKNVPKDKSKITVHQLLTHTSGLPDFYANRSDHFRIRREEAVYNILKEDLLSRPGGRFSISNAGYTLLAAILEKITQQSYLDFLRDHIFIPSGMHKTGFHGDEIWRSELLAKGYGFNEKAGNIPSDWPRPSWMIMGASEIVSNLPDLYLWWKKLFSGTLITKESLELMQQKHALDKTKRFIEYGYGIKKRMAADHPVYYYNGGGEYGQICSIRHYPQDNMNIILLSNSYVDINPLASVLISQVEKAIFYPEKFDIRSSEE